MIRQKTTMQICYQTHINSVDQAGISIWNEAKHWLCSILYKKGEI